MISGENFSSKKDVERLHDFKHIYSSGARVYNCKGTKFSL